jgi:hypothetical protein
MGFFSDQKSSSTGSNPVAQKLSTVWGSIFDQRKIPLHQFTLGFQKPEICANSWFPGICTSSFPGICANSWFLESNGKMVHWDFSLIK